VHALPFSDRPRYAVCRLKQWLHLARDTQQAAYEALKFCETLPEVLALVHAYGVFASDASRGRATAA
jgi:hypothetical protein